MFRQVSIYQLKTMPPEERATYGVIVLVTRMWMRGVRCSDIDFWMPSAGPSKALLTALGVSHSSGQNGSLPLTWEAFAAQYRDEQLGQNSCRVVYGPKERRQEYHAAHSPLEELRELEQRHGTVTLACWETEGHCHRHELLRLLTEAQP